MITRREFLAALTAAGVVLQLPDVDTPENLAGLIENEGFEKGCDAWLDTPARFSWTPEGGRLVEIKDVESVSVKVEPLYVPMFGELESQKTGTITLESGEFWDCNFDARQIGRLRFGIGRYAVYTVQAFPIGCSRTLGLVHYTTQRTVFRYLGPWEEDK